MKSRKARQRSRQRPSLPAPVCPRCCAQWCPMLLYGLPEQDPSWSPELIFLLEPIQQQSCLEFHRSFISKTFKSKLIHAESCTVDISDGFPWFQSSSTDSSWVCYICIIICGGGGFIWINESIQTHGGFLRWGIPKPWVSMWFQY